MPVPCDYPFVKVTGGDLIASVKVWDDDAGVRHFEGYKCDVDILTATPEADQAMVEKHYLEAS